MLRHASKALRETITQATQAFNRAARFGFANKTGNSIVIHKANYTNERQLTQLPSQLVCSVFTKAGEALRSRWALQRKRDDLVAKHPDKFKPKTYRCPQSDRQAVRYDNKRAAMVKIKEGWATLASVSGRQEVKFNIPSNFSRYENWKVCSSDLLWDRKDRLFLHVVLEGEGKPFVPNGKAYGVDLGIKRPAVISNADGSFNKFLGEKRWADKERKSYSYRRILQGKGTKPARRMLKRLSGKVNRFRSDCDHVLSKQIVESVPTGSILVFENLKDIRERCGRDKGKKQNGRMHRWSFARLFELVDYKARLAGVGIEKVDPRNTSRRCSKCGDTRKSNRKNQSHFECHACHLSLNADLNGARNIARKFTEVFHDWHASHGRLSSSNPMSPDL